MNNRSLVSCCIAEALGTGIIVFFGCGAVHVDVLTDALEGLWQVAIVWGLAVMLAIYVTAGVSGAHLNPAITVGLAVWRNFTWHRVGPYIAAQITGAFVAATALFVMFGPYLTAKEAQKNVVRGGPGSEITAMCYGEYFPNPGSLAGGEGDYSAAEHDQLNKRVPEWTACFAEVLATLLLALVVCASTDPNNSAGPGKLAPAFIGLTVTALICVIGPLTQAGLNPARDFGPRLFACIAGWGSIALPGPRGLGVLTVYILSPIAGGILGVGLYRLVIGPAMADEPTPASNS